MIAVLGAADGISSASRQRQQQGQNPHSSSGVCSSGAVLSLPGALGPSLLRQHSCLNGDGRKRGWGHYQLLTKPIGLMETKQEISENFSTGCSSELLILSSDNKPMSFPKHEWAVSF